MLLSNRKQNGNKKIF